MKIVSYNIHYAIGKDDRYDLQRVTTAVAAADIIALQEVERYYDTPQSPSQPEDIAALLPEHYWVYDASFDIDCSERQADGRIINRRRQHGQMLLSRWPIIAKRYFALPRVYIDNEFNMQMGVLEGIIDTPLGALRIYNVHFGSVSSEERQQQADRVLELVREAPSQGGAWSGPNGEFSERDWCVGNPEPPMPATAIVLGDFNMQPDSREYQMLCDAKGVSDTALLIDVWALFNPERQVMSWHSNPSKRGPQACALLDYCLVTEALTTRTSACWIDEAAAGSDHQPLWAEFDVS
ncbi:MAG: endonuclease/exonuclease/phosphatase family protein [Gammaproteobacteria bacterium]|jgi:endonuclease/exonuclease/phosphatase family metal-dependent hydrolase|nr:endonuclease/exonuclease/phosphatase family protein [Gammaproteobacteria bacterium]